MNRIAFLKQVLSQLDQEHVKYCILRNYEFLLDDNYSIESLDATIAEKDFKRFEDILFKSGFQKRTQQFSLKHQALL